MSETFELAVTGAATAFTAGAVGSLHCAVICGPLACAGLSTDRGSSIIGWQTGRIASYAGVGLALGWSSRHVAQQLAISVQPYLPWVMALGLVAMAFEFGKHLAPLPGFSNIARGWYASASGCGPRFARRSWALRLPFCRVGSYTGSSWRRWRRARVLVARWSWKASQSEARRRCWARN
jgi:hypothetical protein